MCSGAALVAVEADIKVGRIRQWSDDSYGLVDVVVRWCKEVECGGGYVTDSSCGGEEVFDMRPK